MRGLGLKQTMELQNFVLTEPKSGHPLHLVVTHRETCPIEWGPPSIHAMPCPWTWILFFHPWSRPNYVMGVMTSCQGYPL